MFASVAFVLPLLAQAAATPAAAGQQAQPPAIFSFMPLLFIGVIFYFVIFRPQQKRAKDQAALLSSVRSGDEVVTSGGLHGIVSNAREADSRTVLVKFAENVKIEVDKSAITAVVKPAAGGSSTASDASASAAVPVVKVR